MPDLNAQLASLFAAMADMLTILDADKFKVNAYARASRSLENLPHDLRTIGPDVKKLAALDGIGKSTAQKIAEFLETGRLPAYDEIRAQLPPDLPALLDIPGLGPKTIALLWREAGIESLAALKAKLAGEELTNLPGFGAKKLENLRKAIAFQEQAGGRVRLGQALPVASWFIMQLRKLPGVQRADYAGSLRRGKETIGDVDLLVAAGEADAPAISAAFVALAPIAQVLVQGPTKTSVRTKDGLQCDLRIVRPEQFGAALMYFTGSKEHNVAMRQRALNLGMSLNEYALTRDGQPIASATEEEVFAALKLAWVPAPLREDQGELALAERGELPRLVTRRDIRAELHTHTTASDGHWSIREIALAAIDHGFHTLAITDHSRSQAQANGLDEKRLRQHIADIREVAEDLKDDLTLLAGSEVDILADGSLDYPNSVLAELDVVVASPHSALSQEPAKATDRLLRAIDNPYVTIMGHATGRLINRREGLHPDMGKLFAAAAQRGIAFEINANHYRLDLRDRHAKAALAAGVKLAINTDAHGPADLDELVYGVLTAQRAGATPSDIINCLDRAALRQWIDSTRRSR